MSLFSVFDPVSMFGQFNWLSVIFPLIVLGLGGYFLLGGGMLIVVSGSIKAFEYLYRMMGAPVGSGVSLVVTGLMAYLALSNILGLFPFVFTHTAHPSFTLGLGVVGWVVCVNMGWTKNFSVSAAHLVPEGSPLGLSFVLVIIESISHLIRPFTLSIRLAANMMAGHLIIGLISSVGSLGMMGLSLSVFMQSLLMLLELGVAFVQGLVFSILLLLYTVEYC